MTRNLVSQASETSLERVRRVRAQPLEMSNGRAAPVLRTICQARTIGFERLCTVRASNLHYTQ